MSVAPPLVFLLDVDNTLLDNDGIQLDLGEQIQRLIGTAARRRYFDLFEQLREQLGYADYLGALQRYRLEIEGDARVLELSDWMLGYPFAGRLFDGSLPLIRRLRQWGPTVLLSDGDAVFQPHKIRRAGLWDAVEGRVLIYVHKEQRLADVERLYPAQHYVLIDDKLRVLDAVKRGWGERVTTVIPRQGHYAADSANDRQYAPADLDVPGIGSLLHHSQEEFMRAGPAAGSPPSAGTSATPGLPGPSDIQLEWAAQVRGTAP